MKISLHWLNEFLSAPVTANEASDALTRVGIEVARCDNLAAGLENVVVAKIEEMRRHPNADRLTLCIVNDGGKTYPVVCGAKNMKAGDRVALALVGASLPNGITIKESKIRGELSQGMLCSESELKFSEESDGILILPPSLKLGEKLAVALDRNDWLIEVELTPNRGDCLSVIGLAREVAASLGRSAKIPLIEGMGRSTGTLRAKVTDSAGAPRYVLRKLEGVVRTDSPAWLKARLAASGVRSLHPVVDVTNVIMLEWGQPLHAFDAAKVVGEIEVRRAREGEQILCLDGAERSLTTEDLVIADQEGAVAIAGVMGGARTAVGEETASILLESAYFDPRSIRRTSRRLSLATESSYRFERNVDPSAAWMASQRAVELLEKLTSAREIASVDLSASSFSSFEPRTLLLRSETLRRVLGADIDAGGEYLSRLGLGVEKRESGWQISVPSRRPDLEREIDLVEEVARLHGFDRFRATIPEIEREPESCLRWEAIRRLKLTLKASGLSEVRAYSFGSRDELETFSSGSEGAYLHVMNPLSPDMEWMRTSLLPSLVRSWVRSRSHQAEGAALFEIGRTFAQKQPGDVEPAHEETWLAAILVGSWGGSHWSHPSRLPDYYDARGIVEGIFREMNWGEVGFRSDSLPSYLHPGKSASLYSRNSKIGHIGVLHPSMRRRMELEAATVIEVRLDPLFKTSDRTTAYSPMSAFPWVRRDLAFVVSNQVTADEIVSEVRALRDLLVTEVELFDRYEGKGISEGKKSLAFRITLASPDRTLTDAEADATTSRIVERLKGKLGATLRG